MSSLKWKHCGGRWFKSHEWGHWQHIGNRGHFLTMFKGMCRNHKCGAPRFMEVFDNGSAKETLVYEITEVHKGMGLKKSPPMP